MKKNMKSILALVCICACISLLLALTNAITKPYIDENKSKAEQAAQYAVMPNGGTFELMDTSSYTLPGTVKDVFKASNGGFVISLVTTGFSPNFNIMCGVNVDGTVSGATCISSNETLGKEKTYGDSFKGKDLDGVLGVDTIAGATKTTEAYRSAIKDAINAATVLSGGSAVLSPEEIYANNLAEALPSANGDFEKPFITEVLDGVNAVHKAKNNTGFVYVIGEQFIAVDAAGKIVTECDEATQSTVKAAIEKINSTTAADINLANYEGLPSQLIWAKRTVSGNYIIQIKGVGYGINGGDSYHPASGEYIIIQLSMTKDGKIIDCYTVSQGETDGFGAACADEKFFGQFDGKTETNYKEIDAIGGATMTTDGYLKAIERAFNSVKIFEGGQ